MRCLTVAARILAMIRWSHDSSSRHRALSLVRSSCTHRRLRSARRRPSLARLLRPHRLPVQRHSQARRLPQRWQQRSSAARSQQVAHWRKGQRRSRSRSRRRTCRAGARCPAWPKSLGWQVLGAAARPPLPTSTYSKICGDVKNGCLVELSNITMRNLKVALAIKHGASCGSMLDHVSDRVKSRTAPASCRSNPVHRIGSAHSSAHTAAAARGARRRGSAAGLCPSQKSTPSGCCHCKSCNANIPKQPCLVQPMFSNFGRKPPKGLLPHLFCLQITYGATIASFLGGIHWGVAMLDPRRECNQLPIVSVPEQMQYCPTVHSHASPVNLKTEWQRARPKWPRSAVCGTSPLLLIGDVLYCDCVQRQLDIAMILVPVNPECCRGRGQGGPGAIPVERHTAADGLSRGAVPRRPWGVYCRHHAGLVPHCGPFLLAARPAAALVRA